MPHTVARTTLLITSACLALPSLAQSDEAPLMLSRLLSQGRPMIEIRPRYAFIDESLRARDTDAWTVRARLGYRWRASEALSLVAEGTYTDVLGARRLNDDPARIGQSPYPLLPDPRHHGVNQLFADVAPTAGLKLRLGRQVVRLDDERFVSDVDFRQTPQVFDGVLAVSHALPGVEVQLGEFRRMRTVLGRTNDIRLHLAHAAWNWQPGHVLAGFWIGHDAAATGSQTGFAHNAQRIAGVKAEGGLDAGGGRWLYTAVAADQRRIGEGDARIDARYWHVGGGFAGAGWGVKLDHEVKGSKRGVYGFQTPLADFYAWNGWALQYTSTPREGLVDSWVTARRQLGRVELYAEAHRYKSDFGRLSLGRELDLGVTWHAHDKVTVKLQHAHFRPGAGARTRNEVDKTWLALVYRY